MTVRWRQGAPAQLAWDSLASFLAKRNAKRPSGPLLARTVGFSFWASLWMT